MWPFSLIAGLRRHIDALRSEVLQQRQKIDLIRAEKLDLAARYQQLEIQHQDLLQKAKARGVFVTEPSRHRPEPPKPASRQPMAIRQPMTDRAQVAMKQTADTLPRSNDDTALNTILTTAVIMAVSEPSPPSCPAPSSPSSDYSSSSSSSYDSGASGGSDSGGGGGSDF